MKPRLAPLIACALLGAQAISPAWEIQAENSLGAIPGGGEAWQRELGQNGQTIILHGVSFRAADYFIRVADLPPPNQTKLASVAPSLGAAAGCNASYFHEDFRPLGLVISGGNPVHALERAKLLSGILAVRDEKPELVRPSAYRASDDITEAVQAGPWLIEDGHPTVGLDSAKRARRTIIATDGKGKWAIIALSPATLEAAASALASGKAIPEWAPEGALNLDGGSSTALWADTKPEALVIPEFGYVRNFLVIVPKR